MYRSLKTKLRDIIPLKYQVPAKYWYGSIRSKLEKEIPLLSLIVNERSHVLDIGGNRGSYSYHFWRLKVKTEVFEPNPKCSLILKEWAKNKNNISVHCVALSNQEGETILHIPIDDLGEEHDASGSLEKTTSGKVRNQSVTLRTLDSYQFEKIDFIKIDVEGHEYNVIQGAKSLIANSKPALLIEIEQRHNSGSINQVFEMITKLDYQGYFFHKKKLYPIEKFKLSLHQTEAIFEDAKKNYINNFFFFHNYRLKNKEYENLFNGKKSL